MEYYIEPVDEERDFLRISSPEEISVIETFMTRWIQKRANYDLAA
ncbi:hypothetical protein [Schaalia cardiffensis]|nr:hypothetical protein [Schaalia cardiffensis]